ncbi:hypothetical protein HWV62_30505 [Athelia sp. TMB]|nr:hypothetical protein HWV62_30505 [Athelia sp. TMB]
MMGSKIDHPSYPAPDEHKSTAIALDPSSNDTDALAQFQLVEVAPARAKLERAAAENRLIPIASLPHEILSRIFEVHRDLHFGSDPWADRIAPSTRVSHVSAKWRDIALSTASLWAAVASFPHYTSEFYHTMIHRSRESLLELSIRVQLSHDKRSANLLAEFIPSQAHRICALRIWAPMDFIDDRMPALRKLSAPRMTRLYLHNDGGARIVLTPFPDSLHNRSPPPPRRIFTGGVPRLSHYAALNFSPRIWPPLSSIKELNIHCSSDNGTVVHPVICEAALTVSRLFVRFRPGALANFTAVQMPSLEYMEIIALLPETAVFLEMTTAPLLKQLCLFIPQPGRLVPPLTVHGTAVGNFPGLQTLQLQGALGSGILPIFPTIQSLLIADFPPRLTQLGDMFDSNQEEFSTLTPCLTCITAPERLRESIHVFGVARRSLGLSLEPILTYPSPLTRVPYHERTPGALASYTYALGPKMISYQFCATCGVCVFLAVHGPPDAVVATLPPARQALVKAKREIRPVNIRALDFFLGREEGEREERGRVEARVERKHGSTEGAAYVVPDAK